MNLRTITDNAINPALALLPQAMDGQKVREPWRYGPNGLHAALSCLSPENPP